jgi:hypothetical protein
MVSGLFNIPNLPKEFAEEEQHHQIRPSTSQAHNNQQRVPKGHTRAKLSSTSTTASTVNPKNDRTNVTGQIR